MSKYSRLQVLNTMLETGMVPIFYNPDSETAKGVVQACLDGGVRCVEFTNRGDGAHLVFTELVRHFQSDERLILGAGTLIDPASTALYLQLGANFIVGPNLSPEVARLCNRRMVAYVPGCGTATEISNAHELGMEICKIFPAKELGGPSFVQLVRGPLPWARLMPTGGVEADRENVHAWIKAGTACLGMGSKLISTKVTRKDFPQITTTVRQMLAWIQEARAELSQS